MPADFPNPKLADAAGDRPAAGRRGTGGFRFWPSPLRTDPPDPPLTPATMPPTWLGFVWRMSAHDQVWLALLSIAVAVLGTAPIEVQRRIVNQALKQQDLHAIATLALIYAGLVITQGLLKLTANVYRAWVGANTTRILRTSIDDLAQAAELGDEDATATGVKVSIIVAESDAVGGFVGDVLADPIGQVTILVTVFGYMIILQPKLAAVSLLIFAPQLVFVPLLQRAINRRVRARIALLRAAGADIVASHDEQHAQELGRAGRFAEIFHLDMGVFRLKFTLNFLMNITTHLGMVAILSVGAWFVVQGQTQVGTVVAFLSGLSNVNDPWGDLVNWYQNFMVSGAKYALVRDAVTGRSVGTDPQEAAAGEGGPVPEVVREIAAQ